MEQAYEGNKKLIGSSNKTIWQNSIQWPQSNSDGVCINDDSEANLPTYKEYLFKINIS